MKKFDFKNPGHAGWLIAGVVILLSLVWAVAYSFTLDVPLVSRLAGFLCWAIFGFILYKTSNEKLKFRSDFIKILFLTFCFLILMSVGFGFMVGFYKTAVTF